MNKFFLIFVILIIVGFYAWRIYYPAIKGKMGEMNVSTRLSFLPKSKYIVLNDLFFKFGDYTTQIDHLVISLFGIFVIETKNYKGWIFGSSNKNYWTQNIWGNKYTFFNPIFQNESHIRFLKRNFNELSLLSNHIYPIVAFLNANRLVLNGDCDCVIWGNELNKYIKSFNVEVLTQEHCEQIATILSKSNIKNKNFRDDHIRNVYIANAYTNEKINRGKCPRCGGELVIRSGPYGNFYGCSNYPSCRFSHNIM